MKLAKRLGYMHKQYILWELQNTKKKEKLQAINVLGHQKKAQLIACEASTLKSAFPAIGGRLRLTPLTLSQGRGEAQAPAGKEVSKGRAAQQPRLKKEHQRPCAAAAHVQRTRMVPIPHGSLLPVRYRGRVGTRIPIKEPVALSRQPEEDTREYPDTGNSALT